MRSHERYQNHCGTCGHPVITDGTLHAWSDRIGLPEKPYDHPATLATPDSRPGPPGACEGGVPHLWGIDGRCNTCGDRQDEMDARPKLPGGES